MSDFLSVNSLVTVPILVWAGLVVKNTGDSDSLISLTTEPTYNSYSNQRAIIAITNLDSDKYCLRKPIFVSIMQDDAEFLASFDEAELCRSGVNEKEAIEWLQSSIVNLYDSLKNYSAEQLGPLPTRQLRVLGDYLVEMQNPKA